MKKIIILLVLSANLNAVFSQVQANSKLSINWHLLDLKEDSVYGMSMEKAYRELLSGKKHDTIIVAVIDGGIDTLHEDLMQILWININENGYDSDHNGYAGDKNGWNFLGGKEGKNITAEFSEIRRRYLELKGKYKDVLIDEVPKRQREEYRVWLRVKNEFLKDIKDKSSPKLNVDPIAKRYQITRDDYTSMREMCYGNGNVMVDEPGGIKILNHGTHVAGIIGAIRNNGIGMDGVSNAVKIMMIRAVPNGDEYDKDIALAIRYAVDNGAKVINMSFGKNYSPNREWVEDAIKYAAKKDVLIVNGAGNDARNVDSFPSYPTAKYIKGKRKAPNMITVGASGPYKENLVAEFSNYGQAVDVFAPGKVIYSTITKSLNATKYGNMSGTSMSSPVVAGLATVLRSYYPKLSARQIKYIIETSVFKIEDTVIKPRQSVEIAEGLFDRIATIEKVSMKELCRTGGIVNAYKAIELAEQMTNK